MQPGPPIETDLVLLGAGHAHVEVLRRLAMRPMPGVRTTLIAREAHTPYSGMLPGLIRGEHDFDAAHVDLAPLAAASGARLLLAEAVSLDLAVRTVQMAGRPEVGFDLLSLDVGGEPATPGGGMPVKPIGRFLARLRALEAGLQGGDPVAVIGGGAGGTELALALARRFGRRARIVLVLPQPAPLPEAPARARAVARDALAAAGVIVVRGAAADCADGTLRLADGRAIAVQAALWATGVRAPGFLARAGLACDAQGCVRVDATLRSVSHRFVFAAGDCAAVGGAARPKAGVWAVRAGAPLAANLRRAAAGQSLRPWHPQARALAILGLGDGRGLAWRGGWSFSGRAVMRWKRAIDARWMERYARLRPMRPAPGAPPMRCGGCGAKVGADVLAGVLGGLAVAPRPEIVGLAARDDAAIAVPPPGVAVVQSVDHFRGFLDDPFVFGEIAAAHALSDLHAMGARPWTALAIAAVPAMPREKMRRELAAMMQGALGVLAADGCTLAGGHSAEAAEAALGFAVTGLVAPGTEWRKAGLRPGNVLILTKPIGTGIVLAGHMQGLVKARWLEAAIASMRRTNADAARLLRAHGARACTDVTGFGLGGHLLEMLDASQVAARLWLSAVPLLPGTAELAARGVASTLAPENRRLLPSDVPDVAAALLADPQTSGGLLAGITAERAEACVIALGAVGITAAAVGTVLAGPPRLEVKARGSAH
ncbi:MAG: selenide, water dikinase SelD [Acidisphaera sp.]|nr:selenide, water dikinase SelD [Acidisphaera sp.]